MCECELLFFHSFWKYTKNCSINIWRRCGFEKAKQQPKKKTATIFYERTINGRIKWWQFCWYSLKKYKIYKIAREKKSSTTSQRQKRKWKRVRLLGLPVAWFIIIMAALTRLNCSIFRATCDMDGSLVIVRVASTIYHWRNEFSTRNFITTVLPIFLVYQMEKSVDPSQNRPLIIKSCLT